MALLTATISGQFQRPDLGPSPARFVLRAATDGERLKHNGRVILGRIPIEIEYNGNARVTIPQIPQSGLNPSGARWQLIAKEKGADLVVATFTLTGDTTWDSLVDVSDIPITASIQAAAEQARDAALAAVASVKTGTWQPTTAYVLNQTVQAPDGTLIKATASRTSRSTFDATEQTFWTAVLATTGTLDQLAAADTSTKTAWQRALRVADLSFPLAIAHRGAGNLGNENTIDAYKNSANGLAFQAVEAGDVQALSDGTLVCMHDPTVDRTTTGTGNVNTFTKATWAALNVDSATVWGGTYTNTPAPFWDDVLAQLAGRCVIVPEVKDGLDATATAMCNRLDALGVRESTIIASFTLSNLTIAAGRGYKTMMTGTTFASLPTFATLTTGGVWSVCVDHGAVDFNAATVALWQQAGFKVFTYTIDHQADWNTAVANGVDGVFTNESKDWISGNVAAYRRTQTTWHRTGKYDPGTVIPGDGPFTATTRGTIIGGAGGWRLKPIATPGVLAGSVSPVANAAGTYTVNATSTVDTIPTTTTDGPAIAVATSDDLLAQTGGNPNNCYFLKVRANGGVQAWVVTAGVATSLGTLTATAFQQLNLTAALTAGTPITSLTVSALTVALKVGHQFTLPNGQVVTVNAAAIIGATSVTISSFTPTQAFATSTKLQPYVTMTATITPSNVTFSRGDEPGVGTITAANTAQRGGYIVLSSTAAITGAASYHKVTVT